MTPAKHACTDPRAVLTYDDEQGSLAIQTDDPDALLIELRPREDPPVVFIHVATLQAASRGALLEAAVSTLLQGQDAGFVAAKTVEDAAGMTHKQMLVFLKKHPEVGRRHPQGTRGTRPQRLEIQGAEFIAAAPLAGAPSDDAIDRWVMTSPQADEILDRWFARVRERYEEEHRHKAAGCGE